MLAARPFSIGIRTWPALERTPPARPRLGPECTGFHSASAREHTVPGPSQSVLEAISKDHHSLAPNDYGAPATAGCLCSERT